MTSKPQSQPSAMPAATMTAGEGIQLKSLWFVLLYCITNYLWHKLFCPSFKDLRSTWETKPCHMIVSSCLIHTHQRLMRVWGHPKTAFMGKLNLYRYSSLLWFIHISAVKWLIASKISFCLHNICLCTVYIYYVQPKIRKIWDVFLNLNKMS